MIHNALAAPLVRSLPDRAAAEALLDGDPELARIARAGWETVADGALLMTALRSRESTGPGRFSGPLQRELWVNSLLVGWRKDPATSDAEFWRGVVGLGYAFCVAALGTARRGHPGRAVVATLFAGPDPDDIATVYLSSRQYGTPFADPAENDLRMMLVLDTDDEVLKD